MGARAILTVALLGCAGIAAGQDDAQQRWVSRFRFDAPKSAETGVCAGRIGELPAFRVTPDKPGRQLVRVSLPFAAAALPDGLRVGVRCGEWSAQPDLRVLTHHAGRPRSVRRAIVTFEYEFADTSPRSFELFLPETDERGARAEFGADNSECRVKLGSSTVFLRPDRVWLEQSGQNVWSADLVAPAQAAPGLAHTEAVELGAHYAWVRLLAPDTEWPRIIEVRMDSLGRVAVQAHVQRLGAGDATAPELGWRIGGLPSEMQRHSFADGKPFATEQIAFPQAAGFRRGYVDRVAGNIEYRRCTADEGVPFQSGAWRTAAFSVGPWSDAVTPLLEPALDVDVAAEAFDAVYGTGTEPDLALWTSLGDLRAYTADAIKRSMALGDDFGNVTLFTEGQPASRSGMNRLNHGPAIFEEAWRTGDRDLRDTAALWCSNMYDLSLWWGDDADFGGTRYNNAVAAGEKAHESDTNYMWRTNNASHFCTKGFDTFFLAYEETGDPRMLAALRAQVEYAKNRIHVNTGEARNIGDVRDFMNLYRWTGLDEYRQEALRLFRELREKLSPGDLFSQGGQPIVPDGPFIDDDQHGYEAPFAKPYIIGYALAGLPDLLREYPDEPKLRDVVRAVADFLASTVDPAGGWRYPHPRSSGTILSQGLEHASQLVRAAEALEARPEPIGNLLNAVETVLQARVNGFDRTGTVLAYLSGWESSTDSIPEGKTIYDLYAKPADRDPARDYTDGAVAVGNSAPEGLVYLGEVLSFYLRHRPAERLFHANAQLRQVIERVPDRRLRLTPQEKGAYLRIAHPDSPEVGFTLWAPEWVSFPNLGYGEEELGGMALDWKRDEATGAVSYSIERDDATFHAAFLPHSDYVECFYTTWPKPGVERPASHAVGPCQQMKAGVFEGDDADLLGRLWYLSNGQWVTVASGAAGNARNVLYIRGNDSPEMSGAMAEGGWKTVQDPRPDNALIACTSADGQWVAAAAAEHSTSLANNANASHRCIHSQGGMHLNADGPTTLRVNVYLLRGGLDGLRARYERDAARWAVTPPSPPSPVEQTQRYGMRAQLPVFSDARVQRMDFPLAWSEGRPFADRRAQAREAYVATLQTPPPRAPFDAQVLAVEDRGGYEARKLALNLSADSRVEAYLLVPKGKGPFPALVALHDHGAHFSIGKEKVIKPFGVPPERMQDAQDWVTQCYGGRWIGDELAARGYVVFATDALFWGDRGRFEGIDHIDQQALGANMLQLGMSWAGNIVWDDVRSAEFVQSLPEVDPGRIGCLGLSMGSHRTWNLCAATDVVKCGAAICWMGDTPELMAEGNNQTKGTSAFSMIHPGVRAVLDYPDVASIACPKPMLFYNGTQDGLFPVPGVERSYAKMRRVWDGQGAGDRLETRLWDVPHEFNVEMQEAAFAWLDRWLKD